MLQAINEAVSYIREKIKETPETAIILGSGLGGIVDHIEPECEVIERTTTNSKDSNSEL